MIKIPIYGAILMLIDFHTHAFPDKIAVAAAQENPLSSVD